MAEEVKTVSGRWVDLSKVVEIDIIRRSTSAGYFYWALVLTVVDGNRFIYRESEIHRSAAHTSWTESDGETADADHDAMELIAADLAEDCPNLRETR